MAYAFASASSQYMRATVSGYTLANSPMTMHAWIRPSGLTSFPAIIAAGVLTGNVDRNVLAQAGSNIAVTANGGGTVGQVITTTGGITQGNWHAVGGVFASASSRTAYINGVNSGTNTTTIGTAVAATDISIGSRYAAGAWGNFFPGDIAEVGVWDAALTAAEMLSLARGMSPSLVRPQSLAFYAPLIRTAQDVRRGLSISNVNGATVAAHTRVYL